MAQQEVQKLRHGKVLCKRVFGRFVETFNFLVDWTASVKGDRDVNPAGTGHIRIDRADPGAPVIRCDGCGGGADTVDVVVHCEYNTTTHRFVQYKRTIAGVKLMPATSAQLQGEVVFETTPLSAEYSG